jgi:hypothetical protein
MNEWFAPIWYEQWKRMETEIARGQWARSAFLNRSQSPDGFFYACGKREDGIYQYVGFRYGVEDSQYASGFLDMSYTPQGEEEI